jgi:hypothetical protein
MRIVGGADTPEVADDVAAAAASETESSDPGFWGLIAQLLGIACGLAAILGVIAAFWGVFLLAQTLWNAMGI